MRFLNPLALIGLALISLPIAIHLLVRRRASKLEFPSLEFLRETPSFRLRPRRIQQPMLLALRVASILLLALGLAFPLISLFSKKSRTRVILLDASFSMMKRGCVEAAREQARSLINSLDSNERATIVAFGNNTTVLSPLTSDKNQLRAAIDGYHPSYGAADYGMGIDLAGALMQREVNGEKSIDVISDFQASGLPHEDLNQRISRSIGTASLITHPVGAELERNAFFIDEVVLAGESGTEVSASELLITGQERHAIRSNWKLNAPAGADRELDWRTEPNGQITARIQSPTPDDFDADDTRFLAFDVPTAARALLIENEDDDATPYFRAAFEAAVVELGDKHFLFDRKTTLPAPVSELSNYSLVTLTLHGKPDPDEMHVLADYARSGGTVWICIGGGVDTSAWDQFAATDEGRFLGFARIERSNNTSQAAGFGSVDADAPAIRAMNKQVLTSLRSVRMRQDVVMTPRDETLTLIRWNNNTAAFVQTRMGSGRVLLLATSPARSDGDLGSSPAFPALASAVVRFSNTPREPVAHDIGQPVHLGLAVNAPVRIIDARGKTSEARARELIVSPSTYFPEPGIYRIESDKVTKYIAMNARRAESESALAPVGEVNRIFRIQSPSTDSRRSEWRESSERVGSAWRYFLLAAFGLLIAEILLVIRQRRQGGLTVNGEV